MTTAPARPGHTGPVSAVPNELGRFGDYGGVFVPETLVAALTQLAAVYAEARIDHDFWDELEHLNRTFVGRATPLYRADRLTEHARSISDSAGGATIWLKREDLAHTGAHKINNTL
ncbi:MAG: tryptophan synthase subunit beta, partial [Planctomycetota bacterium]